MPDRVEPQLDNEEMTAALDAALDALQGGQPIDRVALLAKYPQLASALQAMEQLTGAVGGLPATSPYPPPEKASSQPTHLGRYRIEAELGSGGFGVVYLAYDPDVRRRVAIKVLHPGRIEQPDAVSRFQREARATGRLSHPGIVQLFDYSRSGPPYYLITEYIEGLEPRRWCRQQHATAETIAELIARMADALEYAHSQGVYHRDLKPGNILVDAEGQPHILDFGLARLQSNEDGTLTMPTAEGYVLGSLPYMSPEQACGQSNMADARSDVYSLGVVLYELLTGRLPLQGPAHMLPSRVLEEIPQPPSHFAHALSPDLEAICLKALAKRPQDRYARAADLAADLRAYCQGRPVAARRFGWVEQVRRVLNRQHMDIRRQQGWSMLLFLLGLTILAGSMVCNSWVIHLPADQVWLPLVATKAIQVALMVALVVWLHPREPISSKECGSRWVLSATERQVWSLIPGYYGGFLTLVLLNTMLHEPIPLAPVLAVLSGMGFANLGASVWGWFYIWAAVFFVLAGLIVLVAPFGLTLLGIAWFVCLSWGSLHLYGSR